MIGGKIHPSPGWCGNLFKFVRKEVVATGNGMDYSELNVEMESHEEIPLCTKGLCLQLRKPTGNLWDPQHPWAGETPLVEAASSNQLSSAQVLSLCSCNSPGIFHSLLFMEFCVFLCSVDALRALLHLWDPQCVSPRIPTPSVFGALFFYSLSTDLVKDISVQRPQIQTRICLDTGENVWTKWFCPGAEIRM